MSTYILGFLEPLLFNSLVADDDDVVVVSLNFVFVEFDTNIVEVVVACNGFVTNELTDVIDVDDSSGFFETIKFKFYSLFYVIEPY